MISLFTEERQQMTIKNRWQKLTILLHGNIMNMQNIHCKQP